MKERQTEYRGRLAPTPSGFLHAGHIRTFSTAWERPRKQWATGITDDDLDSPLCDGIWKACLEDISGMG